jgi:hypothetical protein
MKKAILYSFLALVLLNSCSGPEGPEGPQGPEGISVFSNVLEVSVDFTASNSYEVLLNFPSDWIVYEADLVMVYLSYETISDSSGPINVWRALPQTLLTNEGLLQYNFDHTYKDIRLFMQADYDLNLTTSADRENQVFKIAVIPAQYSDLLPHLEELSEPDFDYFSSN